MGDLKTTAEERAAPRWCADCGAWQPGKVCPVAGVLHHEGMTYTMAAHTHLRYCIDEGDDRVCHKDLRDALDELDQLVPERDTLRAECERLRGQNAEQRILLRWFLDGDDHTHEDDCGARGQHDLDVCRNTKPCADESCEGPYCTCDATEMRDRARAALGEP